MKTTDFITENQFIGDDAHAMHTDHEVQMSRSDCYSAAKYAIELHKLLKNVSEMHGLDGWVSEKLTLANDYLRTVHEYLTHEMSHPEEIMPEVFTAALAEARFAELLGETTGKQVDMTGKKCTACKKGTYQETSQMDDMDGVLHCNKCRKEVKRHQSDKSTKKDVTEAKKRNLIKLHDRLVDLDDIGFDGNEYDKPYVSSARYDNGQRLHTGELSDLNDLYPDFYSEMEQGLTPTMSGTVPQQVVLKRKTRESAGMAEGYSGIDDTDTIGFSVNSEAAYTAVMDRFGDHIDHDETSGIMYVPASMWPNVEAVAFDADGVGAEQDDGYEHPDSPEQGVAEAVKHGLYYNVNKRKAAGTSRSASNPKAPTDQAWKDAAKTAKKESVAETTSSAGMATAPGVGQGPKTGTLFGGSYAPRTPFTGKKKANTSVIKR
jgi:hypothetical protein